MNLCGIMLAKFLPFSINPIVYITYMTLKFLKYNLFIYLFINLVTRNELVYNVIDSKHEKQLVP